MLFKRTGSIVLRARMLYIVIPIITIIIFSIIGSYVFRSISNDFANRYILILVISLILILAIVLIGYAVLCNTILTPLQKLLESASIAEENNKAKNQFLAKMSHELRAPIAAVLGISEIQLQNPNLSIAIEESFTQIHDSATMLLNITADLLDLSKIEAGKMSLTVEEYKIVSLVNDIANIHLSYLGNKDINFTITIDENLPITLIGDMLRIEQIIINLLSNAFKYTDSGSVKMSIKCEKINTQSVMLIATISDTGFGMTAEQLTTLRNDYTRFHEKEHHLIEGTGLGMSIVYNLAELMDAEIDIESDVGLGTKITVHIPQNINNTEIIGPETAMRLQCFETDSRAATKRFNFTPEQMPYGKVLIVDDTPANLYVAKHLLAFHGLEIETCENGHQVIDKVEKGNIYDIIFMDHIMPGINGIETLHIIRNKGYTGTVIALTANAIIGQVEEYIQNGFDGFLSKPIQATQLNDLLVEYIKEKQSPETLEATQAVNTIKIDDNALDEITRTLRPDFANKYKNAVNNLNSALQTKDIDDAHLIAHTLKGLAMLIEENQLAKLSSDVERILAKKEVPSQNQLAALENELNHVIKIIEMPS